MNVDQSRTPTMVQARQGTNVRAPARTAMEGDLRDKHILDTSAWNDLINDPDLDLIVDKLHFTTIVPTALAIAEIAADNNTERRLALLSLIKNAGKDIRPLATPNQLIVAACKGVRTSRSNSDSQLWRRRRGSMDST